MNKRPGTSKSSVEKLVKTIRRKTRQTYSSEEKIRIVLAGLRGEETISVLCRREGISESLYYSLSKEFLEAGKRRLSGDHSATGSLAGYKRMKNFDQEGYTTAIASVCAYSCVVQFCGICSGKPTLAATIGNVDFGR